MTTLENNTVFNILASLFMEQHLLHGTPLNQEVPQGSILEPLLFNLFIKDIFLFIQQGSLCNFAGGKTISISAENVEELHRSRMSYHNWRIKHFLFLGSNPEFLCQKTFQKSTAPFKSHKLSEKSQVIQVSGPAS